MECSFASFMGQIGELTKKLKLFMLVVFQSSLRYQLPVIPLLQDYVGNIMRRKGSGKATNGKTAAVLSLSAFPVKLENILERFSALVLSLSAHFDSLVLAGNILPQPPS
ncbi:hypothetical protein G9A89_008851 [Geosiphon pyriformis]|nr:hypothetical protein G9A89_008851 [Geosiphon pyriformis]